MPINNRIHLIDYENENLAVRRVQEMVEAFNERQIYTHFSLQIPFCILIPIGS